jgi:hypothetical protein
MTEDETIVLRATIISGQRHIDDFTVVLRDLSIGRIMLGGRCAASPSMGASSDPTLAKRLNKGRQLPAEVV